MTEKNSSLDKNNLDSDIKDSVLYEALPRLPPSIEGVTVADIPLKYFRYDTIFPTAGICLDALPNDFKTMIKNA
jgi:hypothetical protein